MLQGFAEPAALALDNARWFGRLRTVGAEEERTRIAEAKSAMLAANALKLETQATHAVDPAEVESLREDKEAALAMLADLVDEVEALAVRAEAGAA